MRVRGLLAFAACAALVLVPGAAPAPAQAVKLVGTVGPGFSISLEFADGRTVTQIAVLESALAAAIAAGRVSESTSGLITA